LRSLSLGACAILSTMAYAPSQTRKHTCHNLDFSILNPAFEAETLGKFVLPAVPRPTVLAAAPRPSAAPKARKKRPPKQKTKRAAARKAFPEIENEANGEEKGTAIDQGSRRRIPAGVQNSLKVIVIGYPRASNALRLNQERSPLAGGKPPTLSSSAAASSGESIRPNTSGDMSQGQIAEVAPFDEGRAIIDPVGGGTRASGRQVRRLQDDDAGRAVVAAVGKPECGHRRDSTAPAVLRKVRECGFAKSRAP